MDRNTLTALLLITVVLILTPYYMELVSPQPHPIYEASDEPSGSHNEPGEDNLSDYSSNKIETLWVITTKTNKGKNHNC
jgi:hypothetical protein